MRNVGLGHSARIWAMSDDWFAPYAQRRGRPAAPKLVSPQLYVPPMDEDEIEETIQTLRKLHLPINGGSGFFGIGEDGVISRLTTLRETTPEDWFSRADDPARQFVAGIELMTSIFDSYCGARKIDEADRTDETQAEFQSRYRVFGAFTPDDSRVFAVGGGN